MTFAGLRGRDEGERGNDHLRPGADAEHLEGELQRVRSVADREGVLAAMGRGELRLEGVDLTAPDVPPLPLIQGPDQPSRSSSPYCGHAGSSDPGRTSLLMISLLP